MTRPIHQFWKEINGRITKDTRRCCMTCIYHKIQHYLPYGTKMICIHPEGQSFQTHEDSVCDYWSNMYIIEMKECDEVKK